jgi:hypothetical protein
MESSLFVKIRSVFKDCLKTWFLKWKGYDFLNSENGSGGLRNGLFEI